MGFRFHKSIKIAPGLRINLSKTGPSLSVGRPGASFNIGPKGTRTTVGAPGTGMSYTTEKSWGGLGKDLGVGKPAKPKPAPKPKTVGRPAPTSRPDVGFPQAPQPDQLGQNYFQRLATSPEDAALIDGCRALAQGNEAEALVQFRKTVQTADGAYMAGVLALKQEQYGEAVNFLSYSLERQAELGQRLHKYGIAATISLPITEEISAQVAPQPDGVLLALAEAYQHLGQPNQAADCLRQLLTAHPADLLLRLSLAELLTDTWPTERAACEEAMRLGDSVDNDSELHAALLLYKARALKGLGLLDGARDVLTSVLRKTKDRGDELLLALRYERALVFQALGQKKEARADFEKVYATNPQYADVAKRLGL